MRRTRGPFTGDQGGGGHTSALAVPPGLVAIPMAKGCILLLTGEEYARAIRRGKAWRRRAALAERAATPLATRERSGQHPRRTQP